MQPDSDKTFSYSRAYLSTKRTYNYVDQRPTHPGKHGTSLLCIHGFPDLSYGWRNQILPWVAQGYRVIAPDMLGYGKTDMPLEASAYTMKRLCDDLAALLDYLGIQKAVVIGHDWGSHIAGRFALWHPKRLLALALLSLPYTPPSVDYVTLQEVVQKYPSYGYQLYFASEHSTAEIEAQLPLFFRILFRAHSPTLPSIVRVGEFQNLLLSGTRPERCILNDKEIDYYVLKYQRGVIGPLSYYRTTQLRFQEEKDGALPSNLPADLPVIFLHGTLDPTCPPVAVKNMGKFIDQLKVVSIPDVKHWIMVEAPQTVTEVILQWLTSVLGPTRQPTLL